MDISTARTLQACLPFGISINRILELGVHKGVSVAYFSAMITSGLNGKNFDGTYIDGFDIRDISDARQLLIDLNFEIPINLFTLPYSYTFEIQKSLLTKDGLISGKKYDLIYLDGSHQFETDLSALFLALTILVPGGYLVIDDLKWSYSRSYLKRSRKFRKLSPYERDVPQMGLIWE